MAVHVWISTFVSVVFFAWFSFQEPPSPSIETNSPILYVLVALGILMWWLGWYLPPRMIKTTDPQNLAPARDALAPSPPVWNGPDLMRFITRLMLFEGTVISGFVATRLSADKKWVVAAAGLILMSLARNFPTENFRRDWQVRRL